MRVADEATGYAPHPGFTLAGFACTAKGRAIWGIACKLPLLPLRVTDSMWARYMQREFKPAVDYAIDIVVVRVINASLGVLDKALRRVVNEAHDNGVVMLCAAGNPVNSVAATDCQRGAFVSGILDIEAVVKAPRPAAADLQPDRAVQAWFEPNVFPSPVGESLQWQSQRSSSATGVPMPSIRFVRFISSCV